MSSHGSGKTVGKWLNIAAVYKFPTSLKYQYPLPVKTEKKW